MMIRELGTFVYHSQQRERFMSGELQREWRTRYADIFDDQDVAIAQTQANDRMHYHFYEWLAAVLLYDSLGYLSLVEQYQFPNHERKQKILRELVPELAEFITHHSQSFGNVQCPDLFVYAPDRYDWFFCKVKGPKDGMHEGPRLLFEELERRSGKPISDVRFREME